MKIVNEKGKLFGLINIVDLVVLLAIVAIIAGIGWKLFAPKVQEAVSSDVVMTTTLRVRGATPFLVNELKRNDQTGKSLVSGNEFVAATIESVDFVDYVQQITTADGRIVDALDPSKKDIMIVIKSSVKEGTPTPKIGTQEVRAGRTFIVKTNDFETTANIDSVDFAA